MPIKTLLMLGMTKLKSMDSDINGIYLWQRVVEYSTEFSSFEFIDNLVLVSISHVFGIFKTTSGEGVISTTLSGVIPGAYASDSVKVIDYGASVCSGPYPISSVTLKNYMTNHRADLKILDAPTDPVGRDYVTLEPGKEGTFTIDLNKSTSTNIRILWAKDGVYSVPVGQHTIPYKYCSPT
jgi:hypothetical protein